LNFVQSLLEYDPRNRMSLDTARSHAWLAGASHYQHRSVAPDDSFALIPDPPSVSLLHLQSEDDAMMADNSGDPGVSSGLDKLHLRQQNRAPLQAAGNELALSDPNWQVVQHAQDNANGVRNGKRKLEPYSNPALDADVENGNLKKPRRVTEANGTPNTRAARSRGGSPMARLQEAAAGMVVEEEHMQEDEGAEEAPASGPATRRKSARVPAQKAARRG
jgi:serine/threonine/tyrosine protein kinase RAD53